MGRRRRPRRLRVRFGNYPREISGRRGGRYTQISAQAKAEAADLFVVGSGASTDEETGETEGAVILRRLREGNSRASSDALISDAVVLDDALNTREELERFSELCRARGVERCVEINQCVGCNNSSLSHFAAMTRPSWLGRAARNRHRHAIEQASRRWRGGRRDERAVKF